MVQNSLDRRNFLRLAGIAAVAAATSTVLASCTTEAATIGGAAGAAGGAVLPNYLPYGDVIADLPGSDTYMAAFYRVPETLPAAFTAPPLSGGSISAMVNLFAPPPPQVEGNPYWQDLNAAIGADLTLNMVPNSDYATKTSTVLAGGNLPDLMNLPLYTPRLGELLPALFADLAPYIGGEKSSDYPYLANIPTDSWRPLVYDGHLYGVPVPRMSTGTVMFKRADILSQLSLDANPRTWDDFVALSKAVTSDRDKRWAMDDPHRLLTFALASLDVPNTWQVSPSGEFSSMITTDAYTDALAKTREFISDGYLHPDGFSGNFDQTRSNYGTGACVFHSDGYAAWDILAASYPEIGVDALRPLETPAGQAYQFTSAAALSLTAVKKGDDASIQRALAALNWLAAPFGTKEYMQRKYGSEGVHFTLTDGIPQLTATGSTETALPLRYITDSAPVLGPGPKALIDAQYDYHKTVGAQLLPDPSIGLYSPTYAKEGATLAKIVSDAQTEILLGHQPVSSWAATVSRWRSAGGDTMSTEYTSAYEAAKN